MRLQLEEVHRTTKEIIGGVVISILLMGFLNIVLNFVLYAASSSLKVPKPISSAVIMILTLILGSALLIYLYGPAFTALIWGRAGSSNILLYGILGGIAISIVNFPLPGLTRYSDMVKNLLQGQHESGLLSIHIFLVGMCQPFAEEVYFRGCLFRLIRGVSDVFWGGAISIALFLVAHSYSAPEQVIPMLIISVLLTWVYHKTNSVLTSGIAHCLSNTIWYIAGYAFR